MTNAARHEHLRQIASALRQRAEVRAKTVPTPYLQQQLGHVARVANEVQVLLRPTWLQHELLDLAETVLRGLDQQLRQCDEAVGAHAQRQARFLERL
jgi:hypothetical protein